MGFGEFRFQGLGFGEFRVEDLGSIGFIVQGLGSVGFCGNSVVLFRGSGASFKVCGVGIKI